MALFDFMADVIRNSVRKSMEASAAAQTASQINKRRENLPGQLDPSDPVRLLQRWAQFAPTAPPGALLSAAKAGVSADSDVGKWIVANVVPELNAGPQKGVTPGTGYQGALNFIQDPAKLDMLKGMSLKDASSQLSLYGRLGDVGTPLGQIQSGASTMSSSGGLGGQIGLGQAPQPQIGATSAVNAPQLQGPTAIAQAGVVPSLDTLANVGDAAKTGLREAGVIANTGAQGIQAGIRQQAGGLAKSISNIAHGQSPTEGKTAGGVPYDPQTYQTPSFHIPGVADIPGLNQIPGIKQSPYLQGSPAGGSTFAFGGQKELTDIAGQTTLGQQLQGKSTGTGFFDFGSPAAEGATLAQRAAATVNGHALTPGRAFAGFVTEPDSVASDLASGLIDMQVSLHGDPMNLLATEISDARKATKLFAPTTADALDQAAHSVLNRGMDNLQQVREWAGALPTKDGEVTDLLSAVRNKLNTDPGSLSQLADAGVNPRDVLKDIGAPTIGAFSGMRRYMHQPTALTWLYGNQGDEAVNTIRQAGFTDLRKYLGKDVPVDYLAQLARSKDPEEIRQLLGQGLGTSVRATPSAGFDFHYDPTARWSQFMPHGSVSHLELNNAVEQTERTLAEVGVPKEKWDGILTKIAGSQTKAQFDTAYLEGVGNAVAQQLQDGYGLTSKRARMLSKFYPQNHVSDGRFWVDEVANTPSVAGLTLDGEAIPLSGPTIGSELAQTIPTLNARELKLSASKMGKIYATIDGVNYRADDAENLAKYVSSRAAQSIEYAASGYTKAFKIGVLSRLGLGVRINAEAQARMATGGLSSMFSHPLDYIAWAMGQKGATDINEVNFLDQLGEASSTFLGSVGKNSYVNDSGIFDTNAQIAKHWVPLRQGDTRYADAWADKLSRLHIDMPSRMVAQAMEDPANFTAPGTDRVGVDSVKDWLFDGEGSKYRQNLIDANLKDTNRQPWSVNLANRVNSDAYVDNVLVPQIMQHTAGDPDLLAAVAHAGPFGPQGIEDGLVDKLRVMADRGVGPQFVNGAAPVQKGKLRLMSNALDKFFSATVDVPYRTMAKSPVWKQSYWKEATRNLPFMTSEAQDALIESARTAGIDLTKPAVSGGHTLAEVAKLANIRAATDAHAMLHYIDERNNVMDTLRYVLPFGDAFRNVVTQWTKLAAENPQALRRVQQGVQEMRSSGFFYKDPKTGDEQFTIVPGAITKAFTGVDFKMTAPVAGLNLASQGLPGVGPAVTLPASLLLPKNNPIADAVSQRLMPYGPPDIGGGIFESLFPGWLDKLKIGGWLGPVGPSADQKVTLQDLAKQVFSYKASTGHYDMSNPNTLAQVSADSLDAAKKLYLLRGLAQFASPSAPNFIPRVLTNAKTAALAGNGASLYISGDKTPDQVPGMLKAGNIDINNRPIVTNKDGTISTVRSITITDDGKATLIPTVVGNAVVSNDDAIAHYRKTGENLGTFKDEKAADAYAQTLHEDQASLYSGGKTKIKDGGYIETWKLSQDYAAMIKATGDSYTATLQFINKYGPNYIFATQAENQRLVYGIPTTADALAFKYAHPSVVRNFPNTYGYFAPQGGAFDYPAYLDAIHSGKIKPLDVDTWAKLANARLGNAVYSNLRSRIPASPSTEQATWLADNKAAIAKEFPGFGDESIKVSRQTLDGPGGTIDELRRAVKDPALEGTDLAHATAVYLELRDRALSEARQRTGKSTSTLNGNAMADLRDWLYQNGTIIATKIPDFTTMWNDLFLNEVAPPTDPSLGATDPSLATSGY